VSLALEDQHRCSDTVDGLQPIAADNSLVPVRREPLWFVDEDAGPLVLAGVSTSGVVPSTVRDAVDRDFRIIVLSDGCVDPQP
jgi:hypothetical protein